ncbi:LysE family translocator [Photorhabdus temperata]|uniref:Putative threonine efflux protein n=1 Tax=Photorhabdus temperata subsp. temperata Meg1 TaxID=1393735 RepID=A0A081RWM7_PHOTE|nr:LysE family translocator [Photorhabdus temperata]KER03080.1 putative threonine efflux protein [Photorhabdus temperata subsp. temperata Meg1]MCT8345658.1 LysE family translocator [Photorhabdus temperata]
MLETSLLVITISTLGMLSPGPDFFLVVKNAIRYQRSAAMMTVMGLIAAIACHMVYCVAGLAILITTTPWLFNLMKYAGAAYLIWIGINSLLSRGGNTVTLDEQARQIVTFRKAFMQGFLCNLLNPKATLFFLAIFTQILNVNSGVDEKLWYAFIIWSLAVIYWPLLVILIQSAPIRRGLVKSQKIIDKLLGVVLIGLGVKVALG